MLSPGNLILIAALLLGKGVNVWDHLTHTEPHAVANQSTADISCDAYHKTKEDVALLKNLGVNFYRFSVSWARILPTGFINEINQEGIRYYSELIDALLKNNITPFITMYHWELPQPIQEIGGFINPSITEYFEDYAKVLFDNFGDRVKYWLTFNEPNKICLFGYGLRIHAPLQNSSGIGSYLCSHHLLRAHANVYRLYNESYKPIQKGKLGIALDTYWYEPATLSHEDVAAAEKKLQFEFGWHAHPIFTTDGDYPEVMRESIARRSHQEGFKHSRLPIFTSTEIRNIRGTSDFFGLNHYTTFLTSKSAEPSLEGEPTFEKDISVSTCDDASWPTSASVWLKVVPWGLRKLLKWVQREYNNPEVFITENGVSDYGELNDVDRIRYYEKYLSAVLDAIHKDGVNVKAYTAWSFLDSFEWADGYIPKFGLHQVNFSDPNRSRTPKASVQYYKKLIQQRKLPIGNVTDYMYQQD